MAYLLSRENEHELCSFCRFSGTIIHGPNCSEKDRHLCRWDERNPPSQDEAFFTKSEHTIKQAAILESLYVTPKIFGVELAMYANFWRISKDFCLTGVGWRGVNLKICKITWFNVLLKKIIPKERLVKFHFLYFWLSEKNLLAWGTTRVVRALQVVRNKVYAICCWSKDLWASTRAVQAI